MRKIGVLLIALAALGATGCAKLTLAWADNAARGEPARPPIFAGAAPSVAEWEAEKPAIRKALEEHVYGYFPDASSTEVLSHTVITESAYGGAGRVEEYRILAHATFGGVTRATDNTLAGGGGFYVDLVLPSAAKGPVPVILMETFCPRWDTVTVPGVERPAESNSCNDGGMFGGLMNYVFGRYIATPPMEMILAHGYGVAAIFPDEVVPDRRTEGLVALAALAEGHTDAETRWGAIAAWAWTFSRVVDVLEADDRIAKDGIITWGHSRFAKAALVAAAYDERIDAVVAHQSGTGGASLNRDKPGESLEAITENYPHWFSKAYAGYAGREEEMPVDQHQLLALIAPRPVLLGNARRDVWSDPAGAFRAAVGADPVYELYGSAGLNQTRLTPFNPQADISFWIRPGTHGVVKEDWPAFLQFLDAHVAHGAS